MREVRKKLDRHEGSRKVYGSPFEQSCICENFGKFLACDNMKASTFLMIPLAKFSDKVFVLASSLTLFAFASLAKKRIYQQMFINSFMRHNQNCERYKLKLLCEFKASV